MAIADGKASNRFTIICLRCRRPVTVRSEWVGREVECPHCSSILRVPPAPADQRPVRAGAPSLSPKPQFNFGCPRCRTLLEAHTGLSGQPGRCPTCGAQLIVPDLDPRTEMPRAAALLDANDQDPTPMHAYAASGTQAPHILRLADGTQVIECPRCGARCPVEADSCGSCGAPFTVEAAPTATSRAGNTWAVTSLVLGILSLPLFILIVPAGLAVLFGVLSLSLGTAGRRPKGGLVGLILGLISLTAGVVLWLLR